MGRGGAEKGLTRGRSKKERSTQSRQMGATEYQSFPIILILLKCRDFATVEATRGFPLALRPLRRVLPCFLFFPAACLFLRQADSHRWTRWGIGAVAAAVEILPACAFRRIPANFLPLNQPASCRRPLGLRTAKSPLFIGKILSNHLSNVSEYDKILSERNQLRQVRTVHEKGDFFDDS